LEENIMVQFALVFPYSRPKLREAIKNFSISDPDRSSNGAFCYSVRAEKY